MLGSMWSNRSSYSLLMGMQMGTASLKDCMAVDLPRWLGRWRICLQCRGPRFDPWVRKIPWRREWQPPVFLPGEFHGQRSLVGYRPWSHKRVNPSKWLTLSLWQFLTKLTIFLLYKSVIQQSHFGIYPRELKTYLHTKTCTQMFIAALLIIDNTWKQSRYPWVDECINKLWYIQVMCVGVFSVVPDSLWPHGL